VHPFSTQGDWLVLDQDGNYQKPVVSRLDPPGVRCASSWMGRGEFTWKPQGEAIAVRGPGRQVILVSFPQGGQSRLDDPGIRVWLVVHLVAAGSVLALLGYAYGGQDSACFCTTARNGANNLRRLNMSGDEFGAILTIGATLFSIIILILWIGSLIWVYQDAQKAWQDRLYLAAVVMVYLADRLIAYLMLARSRCQALKDLAGSANIVRQQPARSPRQRSPAGAILIKYSHHLAMPGGRTCNDQTGWCYPDLRGDLHRPGILSLLWSGLVFGVGGYPPVLGVCFTLKHRDIRHSATWVGFWESCSAALQIVAGFGCWRQEWAWILALGQHRFTIIGRPGWYVQQPLLCSCAASLMLIPIGMLILLLRRETRAILVVRRVVF